MTLLQLACLGAVLLVIATAALVARRRRKPATEQDEYDDVEGEELGPAPGDVYDWRREGL